MSDHSAFNDLDILYCPIHRTERPFPYDCFECEKDRLRKQEIAEAVGARRFAEKGLPAPRPRRIPVNPPPVAEDASGDVVGKWLCLCFVCFVVGAALIFAGIVANARWAQNYALRTEKLR